MKKILIILFRLSCWAVIGVYLLCSFSAYFLPSRYFFSDLLALGYPFALMGLVAVIIAGLFFNKKLLVVGLIALVVGYQNLEKTFATHPFLDHPLTHNDTTQLRILTWNVFYFLNKHEIKDDNADNPRNKMIEAIRQMNPDVLCMQEYLSYNDVSYMVSMDQVFAGMGYRYRLFSNDHRFKTGGGSSQIGTILFSKYPIIDSGRIELKNEQKEHLIYADIQFRQKTARVFTTHMSSLGLYIDTANKKQLAQENIYKLTYERKGSVARKIKRTAILHENESRIIDSAIRQSPYPVIYCADMNAVPCTYSYKKVRGSLKDAFLEKGFGFGQTYDALSPTLRIDVCFVDERLKVSDCFVRRLHGLSDHFPVVTTLQWNNQKP
jgi:endonuclease/exonuclease/phosphatase family metal-dependent hydrolase